MAGDDCTANYKSQQTDIKYSEIFSLSKPVRTSNQSHFAGLKPLSKQFGGENFADVSMNQICFKNL